MRGVMVVVKKNGYVDEAACGGFEVGDDGGVGCGVGCEEAELARIA